MYPVVNLGPFVLPTAGLIYILGAWFSLSLVERAAKALGFAPDKIYGVGATALFAGIVGARITYVLIYWSAFSENLLAVIWPLNSGYNLWGGLVIGLAAGFFYGRSRRLETPETLDALAPGLLLGLLFISLADFLAGPGFGTLSRAPWAISQFSMRRHPVQIYEILIAASALLAWWRVLRYRSFPGQLALLAASIYSGGRLFVDAFRANAWLAPNGIHILQVISLLVLLTSVYFLGRLSNQTAD